MFKQIKEVGGQVCLGGKGCQILHWNWDKRQGRRDRNGNFVFDENGEPACETLPPEAPVVFRYTVFNAEKRDGIPARAPDARPQNWNPIEEAEQVLCVTGAPRSARIANTANQELRGGELIT